MRSHTTGDPALDDLIARQISYGQTRWLEVILACMMVGHGIVFLLPGDTFAYPIFRALAEMIDEESAGWIALLIGTGRLIALYTNGRYRETPLVRMAGCIAGFFYFGAMAWSQLLVTPPASIGVPTFGLLALAELLSTGRSTRDAHALDSLRIRQRERANGRSAAPG